MASYRWEIGSPNAGDIVATLNTTEGILYIEGTGEMAAPSNNEAPFISASADIIGIEIGDGITAIPAYMFARLNKVESVTIPESVTSIGQYAFSECEKLRSVIVPVGVQTLSGYVFSGCTTLQTVTLNEGLKTISDYAFASCKALVEITIPQSVTSISNNSFNACISLQSITVSEDNQKYKDIDGVLVRVKAKTYNNETEGYDYTYNLIVFPYGRNGEYVIPDSIVAINDCAFNEYSSIESVVIPAAMTSISDDAFWNCRSLTNVTIQEGVTRIGQYAFGKCDSITSVVIPSTVTSIGHSAFSKCPSLVSVSILGNVTDYGAFGETFQGCTGLASVSLANGFTKIANEMFRGCTSLLGIILPDSVTSIGKAAFSSCTNLTSINIPNGVTSIEESTFSHCESLVSIDMPYGVTNIGPYAFSYCYNLTNVTIPNSVIDIGDAAFYECKNIESIIIPGSVKNLGKKFTGYQDAGVFGYCYKLRNVTIMSGVENIYNYAFVNCNNITNITIPDTVLSIGQYAFNVCTNLESVVLSESLSGISGYIFCGCKKLENITIPDNVKSIGQSAFYGCKISSITIPDGVTSIGSNAFRNCTHLSSITLPNSVTFLGEKVFMNCTSLISAIIPDSVTKIHNGTFYNCTSLENVTLPFELLEIGDHTSIRDAYYYDYEDRTYGAFQRCTSLTDIIIPDSVQSIGCRSFTNSAIRSVSLNGSVVKLYDSSFSSCLNLTQVSLSSGVTGIASRAFAGCRSLQSITIEDGAKSIEEGAFYGCESLTDVTIPYSVGVIESSAFSECTSLEDVYYKGSNVLWENIDIKSRNEPLLSATLHTDESINFITGDYLNIHWVLYSDGLLIISGEGAAPARFYNEMSSYRDMIKNIRIEDGITSIPEDMFLYMLDLESVTIPATVIAIDKDTFARSELFYLTINYSSRESLHMKNIFVDEENQYFSDIDGVLFNKTQSAILRFPEGRSGEYTIPSTVTEISYKAFYYCKNLTAVIMPEGLTTIGNYAFNMCENFTDVIIPSSVTTIGPYAFRSCHGITEISIPGSVETIDGYAFSYCTNLESVEILLPSSLTTIRYQVFDHCENLLTVNIPDSVTRIEEYAFNCCFKLKDIIIPEGVNYIGQYAFSSCRSFVEVAIPNGITEINPGVFNNCTSLENVTLPEGIMTIGGRGYYNSSGAFGGCTSLRSITLPSSITMIGTNTFSNCTSLSSIEIPNKVTRIYRNAFYHCTSLTTVTIPDSVTIIGGDDSEGYYYDNGVFNSCTSLVSVVLPNSVTTIYSETFSNCTSLRSVVLPTGIRSIYPQAFSNCTSLTSITIPSTVTDLYNSSFSGCTSLEEIYINNYKANVTYAKSAPFGSNAYVVWLDDLYTVRFIDWDGSSVLAVKVRYGESVRQPSVESIRPEYLFVGWDAMTDLIRKDTDVHAVYEFDRRRRLRIVFDTQGAPLPIRMILGTRSGRVIREIPINHVRFTDDLGNGSEIAFDVYKERCADWNGGIDEEFWKKIDSMRLAYCPEFDLWYELRVEFKDAAEVVKSVVATSLGEAELSQIRVYNIEINTETDIAREDFQPTVFYNYQNQSASLLHRLLYKAPHYEIGHVDESLWNIQRVFKFNDTTVYDAFQQVAKEIGCLFFIICCKTEDENIKRVISVYDLWNRCEDCGTRGEFMEVCDKCGSHNISRGYGVDTGVYVDKDNLANEITYSTDIGSIKNCFRLTAGDDLMTAVIVSCNPNGSQYLWYIPEYMQEDMSDALKERLNAYNKLFDYYQKEYTITAVPLIPDK